MYCNTTEVNAHTTAAFLPHAAPAKKLKTGCPCEDGIQVESKHTDFTTDGHLVPIPRSKRGQWITNSILTFSTKGEKKEKKNKALLGIILCEWDPPGTEQAGSRQGDGDAPSLHQPQTLYISTSKSCCYSTSSRPWASTKKAEVKRSSATSSPCVTHPSADAQRQKCRSRNKQNKKRRKILIVAPNQVSLL